MKIVLLAPGLGRVARGFERFCLDLAAELRRAGLDARCWGTSAAPDVEVLPVPDRIALQELALAQLRACEPFANVETKRLQDWSNYAEDQLFAIPAALRLTEILKSGERVLLYARWQGGLVDPSGAPTELLKRMAQASASGQARLVIHTDYVYAPIDALLYSAGAMFHAIGPWIAEQLAQIGVPSAQVVELPMCVAAAPYENCRSHRDAMRRELGIAPDAFVILSVGSFDTTTPDKRHAHLLDEILALPGDRPVTWIAAGARGSHAPPWEEEAKRRLGKRFVALANVSFERMPQIYGAADLFALASLDETFGLVYVEAQFAGLPVVIHDGRIPRHICGELPADKAPLSLVDMRRKGAAAAAMTSWMRLLGSSTARKEVRAWLDGFAEAQKKRFAWECAGPRYAAELRKWMDASAQPQPQAARKLGTWDEQSHRQGVEFFERGQHREALLLIARALGTRETAERWNDWATVQAAMKNWTEAEQGYRCALALSPGDTQAAVNLGALLHSRGRHAEALPLLERGAAIADAAERTAVVKLMGACREQAKVSAQVALQEIDDHLRRAVPANEERQQIFDQELRYYHAVLRQFPPAQLGARALGIGRGEPYLTPALSALLDYAEVSWLPDAMGRWPFDDASMDALLLELSNDPAGAFSEARRVLKPGGKLLVAAPNIASAKSVQSVLGGRAPYVQRAAREFTCAEVERAAADAGFAVAASHTENLFWDSPEKIFSALAASGYPIGSRGDTIFLSARMAPAETVRLPKTALSSPAVSPPADTEQSFAPLHILVIHENLPRPDHSGAEYRFVQVLREMRAQGHSVTYLAPRGFEEEKYVPPLREMGITVYTNDAQLLRREGYEVAPHWTLQEVLREGQFDVAFFYLWFWMSISIPEQYLDEIRRLSPRTRVAVLTDDCHGLREHRGASLSGLWSDHERAADYRERENEIFRRADIVLAVSDDDRKRLAADSPGLDIELLPNVVEAGPPGPPFDARDGLMYLADYNNPASLDGAEWFLKNVFRTVREKIPAARLYLVGTGLPAGLGANEENVVRVGFAPDLSVELAKRRMLVSPVRYGTGTKTKNLHGLAHGVPIITTRIGAEGMDLVDGETALLAETPGEFTRAIVRLHGDVRLWQKLSQNGRAHILKQFPHERMAGHLRKFLDRARATRPQKHDPAHFWSSRLVERLFPELATHFPPQERPTLRLLAYSRTAQQLLAEGNAAEARRQLRHIFSYVPSRVTRSVFFNAFSSVAESVEATYRALGEEKGAAEFRREAARYSPSLFAAQAQAAEPAAADARRETETSAVRRSSFSKKLEFSVIIPTYNRSETLTQCLEALDRQSLSHRRFEAIVVDDGSTDGTAALCANFQARYNLRYVCQPNAGAGAARRRGVERARGKYLLLFNDDTIAAPDLLSVHLQAQSKYARQKLAVLGDFRYPPAARERALLHFLSTEPFLFPQVTLEAGAHSKNAFFVASNLSIDRRAVVDAGSFDPAFRVAEDTELGVRLRRRGYGVVYVPEAKATHQHLTFTIGDLLRRADVYGRTQLALFRKHPHLLGDGIGPFGRLDDGAIETMRSFVRDKKAEVAEASASLAKFDALNFLPFFAQRSAARTAAEDVMDLFNRAVPVVFWFHIFESFLQAWDSDASARASFAVAKSRDAALAPAEVAT